MSLVVYFVFMSVSTGFVYALLNTVADDASPTLIG